MPKSIEQTPSDISTDEVYAQFEQKDDEVPPHEHLDNSTQVAFFLLSRRRKLTPDQKVLVQDVLSQDRWEIYGSSSNDITPENAKEVLTLSNTGLVYKIAGKYKCIRSPDGEDLVQEGNIGLLRGLRLFNETKGVIFTYVEKSIKTSIFHTLEEQGRIIRVPKHMFPRIGRLKELLDQGYTFKDVLHMPEECVGKLKILTEDEYREMQNGADPERKEKLTEEARKRWNLLIRSKSDLVSLDAPIGNNDSESTRHTRISDNRNCFKQIFARMFREELREIVEENLSPRESAIFYMRMEGKTYKEIGLKIGVTNKRIGQILLRDIYPHLREDTAFQTLYKDYEDVIGEIQWE